MIIREPFDPWLKNDQSLFVPKEVLHETGAGIPDTVRACVDCSEDIQQVLDVYIFRRDPSRFFEVGLGRINLD